MKKRIISAILLCLLLLTAIPNDAYAYEVSDSCDEVIHFEDGCFLTISIEEYASRAASTKSGRKTYTYRDANGVELWNAVLTASFTYTGTSSTCTSASCVVTIYDSNWYEKSNTTTRSGNTATTELTIGKKFLGVPFTTFSYTITLSCDENGNLS